MGELGAWHCINSTIRHYRIIKFAVDTRRDRRLLGAVMAKARRQPLFCDATSTLLFILIDALIRVKSGYGKQHCNIKFSGSEFALRLSELASLRCVLAIPLENGRPDG